MNTLFVTGTLVPACLVVFASGQLQAAPYVWDGGGSGTSWTTASGWNSNAIPLNNGSAELTFVGNKKITPSLGASWNIKSLSFASGADDFIIGGNPDQWLTVQNGITNGDSGTQTLNVKIALGAVQTWTSTGGTLVLGSTGADRALANNGHTLTLDGTGNFLFNSQFNGSGGLIKNGSGTATLTYGQNSDGALGIYTGTTAINNGTLITDLGATDGSPLTPLTGVITVGGGTTAAKLETRWLNQIGDNTAVNVLSRGTFEVNATTHNGQLPSSGMQEIIGNLNVSGGSLVQTVSGATKVASLILNGNISHDGLGHSDAVIAGNLSLGGSVKTISVAESGGLQITAVVSNGGITKTGEGTLILAGNNTYGGTTTLSAGTTIINGNQSAAKGNLIVGANATLAGTGTIGGNTTVFGTHAAGGDSTVGTQTFSGNLTYASGSIFSWNINSSGADTIVVNGALTFEKNVILQIVLGDDVNLQSAFWSNPQTWTSMFSGYTGGTFNPSKIQVVNSQGGTVNTAGIGTFNLGSGGVTWAAVPEPTSALGGLLVAAGLFRRRRA